MKKLLTLAFTIALSYSLIGNDFFAPQSDVVLDLKADAIYPVGKIFPFGGFAPHDIKQMKQDGFTFAGPAYSAWQQSVLDRGSKQEQQPQIFAIHLKLNDKVFSKTSLDSMTEEDFKSVQEQIATQVAERASDPAIAWWYLTPEELRPWRQNDMRFFREACATIRKNDPQNRPIWLYLPNHYTPEQISPFAKLNEVVGKGMYPVKLGKQNDRVWNVWSTISEIEAIELSGNKQAIAICVPEMYTEEANEKNSFSIAQRVRFDVWSSLINGAKGVVVFSLAKRNNFPSYDEYYKAYSSVAKELTAENGLGEVLLLGKVLSDVKITVTSGAEQSTVDVGINDKQDIRNYSSLISGEYGYNSERYLFCANALSTGSITIELSNMPKTSLMVVTTNGELVGETSNGTLSITLQPYEVKLMKIVAKK